MAQGSDTKLYVALGVLGVLGAGYFMQKETAKKEDAAHSLAAEKKELPQLSLSEEQTKKITKIVLTKPGSTSGDEEKPAEVNELEKEGESWRLTKPVAALANQKNVESLLTNLTKLEVKEQVGSSKDSYEQFEVTDDQAVRAAFYEGDKLIREIWAGKSGGRGQVARFDGSDSVYVLDGYSSFLYSRNTKGWRDLSILELDPEEITAIDIKNENGEFSFSKGEGKDEWEGKLKAANTFAAKAIDEFEPKKVQDLISAYKKLNASGFADGKTIAETGLEEPEATLTFHLAEDKQQTLVFGSAAEGSSRWVSLASGTQIFSVSSWASDWAFAADEKFQKAKEGEAPAPGGMPPGMPGMPGMPHGMPPGH